MNRARLIAVLLMATLVAPSASQAADTASDLYEQALQSLHAEEYSAAAIHLRNALQQNPRYVAAWVLLADTYAKMGDAPIAITSAEKALELGADSRHVALILARAHLLRGDFETLKAMRPPRGSSAGEVAAFLVVQGNGLLEAHELVAAATQFGTALEAVPGHPGALRGLALTRARQGRHDAAIERAAAAVESEPAAAESWYVRGEVERGAGQLDAALASFARARELSAEHAPALLGEAAILSDLGRVEDAHVRLLEHHELAPSDLQGLTLLAQVQMTLGDAAGAAASLGRAREIVSNLTTEVRQVNLPALMTTAMLAFRDNDIELARGSLSRYLDLQPRHRGARRLLAMAYLRLNQPLAARRLLGDLVEEIPGDPHLKIMLASAYALEGKTDQAEQVFADARLAQVGNSWIYQIIGVAQARGGRPQAALAAFERALDLDEDRDDARLMAVYMQLQLGHVDAALDSMERLLLRFPANPLFQNLAGALHLMNGARDAARKHFENALDARADYPPALLNLAELARQKGNFAAARSRYAHLLDIHPRHVGAMNGMAELDFSQGDIPAAIIWLERIRKLDAANVENRIVLLNAYREAGRERAALDEASQLRRLASDNARAVITVAYVEAGAGNRAVARSDLLDYAQRNRVSADALDQVAVAQSRLRFLTDALATRERIIRQWPAHRGNRYRFARMLIQAGRLAEAEAQQNWLSAHAQDDPRTHVAAAELATARGDHGVAVSAYRAAVNLRPNTALARRLALALVANGEAAAGLALMAKRAADAPGDAATQLAHADLLLEAGRHAAAVTALRVVLANDPDNWRAHNNLAWALLPTDPAAALGAALRALARQPDNPATLDTAGWMLAQNGRVDDGLSRLRDAAARESGSTDIQLHLAEVLMMAGRTAEARDIVSAVEPGAHGRVAATLTRLRAQLDN